METNIFRSPVVLKDAIKKRILLLAVLILSWALILISIQLLEDFLIVDKPIPRADAVVVMAGSKSERLPAAALLFKEGRAKVIILANDGVLGEWSTVRQRNIYQVEDAEDDLVRMHVPRIAIEKTSYTTSGTIFDALHCRRKVVEKGFKSIIIVTSDYHTRRSLWSFERVFSGYPVKIGVYPVQSVVKSKSLLEKFILLSSELAKYLLYTRKY